MDATAILVIFMVALLILALRLSYSMIQRAICQVIKAFRQSNAVKVENAMTLKELGLEPSLFHLVRDYRPFAIQHLAQSEIINITPDGRYFLSERNLAFANRIPCANTQG